MKTSNYPGWRGIFPLSILLMILSCTEKTGPDPSLSGNKDLFSVLVCAEPPPLFASLPGDPEPADTKGAPATVQLGSLVDRYARRRTVFKGTEIIQIPFSKERSGQVAYYGKDSKGDPGEAAVMKRFLVLSQDEAFVVTMVTDSWYMRSFPSFDYLDKPDYTGAVVFSTVSGELVKVQAYESGRILPAGLVTAPDAVEAGKDLSFIVVYSRSPESKSSDGIGIPGPVEGSYAIRIGEGTDDMAWFRTPDGDCADPPEKQYTVSLSCDIPDEVTMTGGGTYTAGSTAVVGYTQKHSVKVFRLDHWTGCFAGTGTSRFSHKVSGDVESTAYFETAKPGTDRSKGVTNPLMSMRIAASNVSMAVSDADDRIYANYYGGTFGRTRTDKDGNAKRHDGLDLYAEVGTPVYAAYSGTVTKAVSSFGDSMVANSYGNELRVTTGEGNKAFVIQYAHLRCGTPFAVNPRTGKPFKKDDRVYQGDLIGFTGRTGNAVDVPNPHLHFGVYSGGGWVDPKPYINGTYASGQKAIDRSKGKITNIRCD